MSAHTSLSGMWVEGSRIVFQFYKDNGIYSREGVGVALNTVRFKENKFVLVSLLPQQWSDSETVATNPVSLVCARM